MLVLSQNKEILVPVGTSSAALIYKEVYETTKKTHHRVCITNFSDYTEALGEYESKDRCLTVMSDIGAAYENAIMSPEGYDQSAMTTRPYISMQNVVYKMPSE